MLKRLKSLDIEYNTLYLCIVIVDKVQRIIKYLTTIYIALVYGRITKRAVRLERRYQNVK